MIEASLASRIKSYSLSTIVLKDTTQILKAVFESFLSLAENVTSDSRRVYG